MSHNITERWDFTLARCSDMTTLSPITEVTPNSRKLSVFHDKPGSFGVSVPIDSEVANKVAALSTCIIARVKWFDGVNEIGRRTAWSGPVYDVNDDIPADTTSIAALGWFEELRYRFLDVRVPYVNQASGAIGLDLLAKANAKVDSLGAVRPTHIIAGTQTDTQPRTRTYERGQNIAAAIVELSEVENGCDIYIDPETRAMSFRPPTAYTDRKNIKFGYRLPPFNLASIGRAEDGKRARNKITVQGSTGLVAIQDDVEAMNEAGIMMEDYISVSDAPNQDILNAYAGAELVYTGRPVNTLTLKPKDPALGVAIPRLFKDFEIGDKLYASVDRGRTQLRDQAVRVFGATLSFDQESTARYDSFDINYA